MSMQTNPTCKRTGKEQILDGRIARHVLKRSIELRVATPRWIAYHCPFCKAWHVGKKPKVRARTAAENTVA